MSLIYHITRRDDWHAAQQQDVYTAPSLQDEGFIHCSTIAQITRVANAIYSGQTNLLLLVIDTDKLTAPLKWEAPVHPPGTNPADIETLADDENLFPHVYGAINIDAVQRVLNFPPDDDGQFRLPPQIQPCDVEKSKPLVSLCNTDN